MDNYVRQLLIMSLCFAPLIVVPLAFYWRRQGRRAKNKVPFDELRRRPPGESLRLKVTELGEKIDDAFVIVFFVPALLAFVGGLLRPPGAAIPATFLCFSLVWVVGFGWRLDKLVQERANYQLGFDGERFVGEELTQLVAKGFEIYHDLPFDRYNIDHVLVGPQGVFAIETKTRRKPVDESGKKEYRVKSDGVLLHWPMGVDSHSIEQAANNARTLAQWLSGAVGETVPVTPILALPGWMVDLNSPRKAVLVVNPKQIPKEIISDSKTACLSENLIKRVCYQLYQKCKMEIE